MRTLLLLYMACAYLLKIGSAELDNRFPECPRISFGRYPHCVCTHGPAYDYSTNTCPNPVCPVNESVGIYPNCTCQHKNFDYSGTFNECFRVCPENSTGYWPECKCDSDGFHFNKKLFQCIGCPEHSSGKYPHCNCDDDSAAYIIFSNSCEKCENGTYGTFSNCFCFNVTNSADYRCPYPLHCPYGSTGEYPDCTCERQGIYNEVENVCKYCYGYIYGESIGVYPDCICELDDITKGVCLHCPRDGVYPNCACEESFQYFQETNRCVRCPANSTGIYPHCKCDNGYFSQTYDTCIECPREASGLYPTCKCHDERLKFSAFINQCYHECPENSSGVQPNCICDKHDEYHYDAVDMACKLSNVGRTCPHDSIGIGPDCLCVKKNHRMDLYYWKCVYGASASHYSHFHTVPSCPHNKGKWPQCKSTIDGKLLGTLVG